MKKSTRKTVEHLKPFVGLQVLRTKPVGGDWSYTSHNPLILLGFTPDGCIRYRHTGIQARILGNKEFVLPIEFTDRNWVTYKKALKPKNNVLNKWRGQKIRRICPTETFGDKSYTSAKSAPTLVSASKHHMVIRNASGQKTVLRSDYMNPAEWEIVDD